MVDLVLYLGFSYLHYNNYMTEESTQTEKITVSDRESGQRLDIFISSRLPQYSRAKLQKAIKSGQITVGSKTVKPRYLVHANDQILIELIEKSVVVSEPVEMPKISIIHEDSELVVINKPAGLLVHPTAQNEPVTIASWFAERYPKATDVGEDSTRPGIVHRLDRDTSGVMVLAKTKASYESLKKQFKKHYAKKEYLALVYGVPNMKEGRINQAIIRSRQNPSRRTVVPKNKESILVGKPAITEWIREKSFQKKYALLRVFPLTGRTHQIRVHMHFVGNPIVGDPLYVFKRQKSPSGVTHQLLHAEKLSIASLSGKKRIFIAALPVRYAEILDKLQKKSN